MLYAEEVAANNRLYNKENKMTKQWTNVSGITFHYDDDKLNSERSVRWNTGVDQHVEWVKENPEKSDFENIDSVCGQMTEEWMDYSNAVSDEHYTP